MSELPQQLISQPSEPLFDRDAGLLMHVSALPSGYGIGDFGPECIRWLDLLQSAGQTLWQVLPLGPTGFGDSPYQSSSTYALNRILLSPEQLHADGLISERDLEAARIDPSSEVDYQLVYQKKKPVIQAAVDHFLGLPEDAPARRRYAEFVEKESWWLQDYALYSVIKGQQGERAWTDWPEALRDRRPEALAGIEADFGRDLESVYCVQFLLCEQWRRVLNEAHKRGIRIVGDIPIFVAHDSADVWANRELFLLEPDGSTTVQAGVPPDYFSETGQLWGNPIYNWDYCVETGFDWWLKRIGKMLELADIIRVDHFRGFVGCWAVPGKDTTAMNGEWWDVPGRKFFEALHRRLAGQTLPIIAEDLGVITPDVTALRDDFGLPGIRILQFAFGTDPMKHTFEPGAYINNCVAYSGTHDNDTVMGWFNSTANKGSTRDEATIRQERENARNYFETDGSEIHLDFIRALFSSEAGAVILPTQDLLGLGSEARFNIPGTAAGNWKWRLPDYSTLVPAIERLTQLSDDYLRGRFVDAPHARLSNLG